jgi:GNAT superfamily N-acetyltransferase
LCRERSRTAVNDFLESDQINHKLGGVPGWKAAFGGRYDGDLVAVCVLSRPVARALDDGDTISISRYASRPDRPANTGSWLIARARRWARLEGYETMIAYSGVAENYGTVYEAAGFDVARVSQASGDSWTSREGRSEWDDYTRRRWEYDLSGT